MTCLQILWDDDADDHDGEDLEADNLEDTEY